MERICPRCGNSDTKITFVGERCLECFFETKKGSFVEKISFEACQKCGKIRRGRDWKETHPSLIALIAGQAMKGVPGHYNVEAQQWEGIWEEGGDAVPFTHPLPIDARKMMCPQCSRATSGYFEGILQLRGNPAKVQKWADKFIKQISKVTFIPKVEDMHGGVDIYIGEKKEIPEMLMHHGLKAVRTEKLSGEKNGKRLYRSTFLIRFEDDGEMAKGKISSGG